MVSAQDAENVGYGGAVRYEPTRPSMGDDACA
jgi:hypothetical protein